METNAQPLSQRDSYFPSAFTRFLWWLATAEKELIKECAIDRNRYAITGMAVLSTWLFASVAWSYFFYTVTDKIITAIALGVFMGFVILNIDRGLIKGINAKNKRKAIPILFRLILALTIGTFMAQPALLYLFDKEIHVQISLDDEQRKIAKQRELDGLYASNILQLQQQKIFLQQQLNAKYNEVVASRNAFIAETDGTGGTGRIGLREIAKAKQNEYIKLDSNFNQLKVSLQPKLNNIDSTLSSITASKQKEMQSFIILMNDGFLTRIEALHNLIQNNAAAKFRYYLLLTILVLIELLPVIAKTLLPDGTYDEKVKLRELMEKHIAGINIQHEQRLKELYNQLAHKQDGEFIQEFFEAAKKERKQKMNDHLQTWKETRNESFDDLWENLKRNMLSKQEH